MKFKKAIDSIKFYPFVLLICLLVSVKVFGAENRLHNFKETPLGYFEDNPDICGGMYSHTLDFSLAKPVELEVGPAKDQGPLGTCASCTVATCYECLDPIFKVSVAELTVLAETQLEDVDGGDCIAGLFLGGLLKIATKMGFVEDPRLPYEAYLKYVAQSNGINVRKHGWKSDLEDLIKRNEEEGDNLKICYRQHRSPISNYNTTMAKMGNELRLYDNFKIDTTSHRLSCVYLIHHITPEDLTRFLERNRCQLSGGTIGTPGRVNISAIRHALNKGYPVAISLGVTSPYQYTPDYFDKENRTQYFKKTLLNNSWDNGTSVIDVPKGCYRDSSNDEIVKFTNGEERVSGASYNALLQKSLYELSGFHAIVLKGFNDSKKRFSLMNSWGVDWGDDAQAEISYEYISLLVTEAFAVAK